MKTPFPFVSILCLGFLFGGRALAQAAPPATSEHDASQDQKQEITTASLERVRALQEAEPSASECVHVALDHFRVNAQVTDELRANARRRALLPVVSGFGTYQDTDGKRGQAISITNPQNLDEVTGQKSISVSFGASWDLRELLFNPSELQVYALVGTHQDIVLEVTRSYFMRRQLQIRLALKPPKDPIAASILSLRVDEYTTILDAFTDGWFSRQLSERMQRALDASPPTTVPVPVPATPDTAPAPNAPPRVQSLGGAGTVAPPAHAKSEPEIRVEVDATAKPPAPPLASAATHSTRKRR